MSQIVSPRVHGTEYICMLCMRTAKPHLVGCSGVMGKINKRCMLATTGNECKLTQEAVKHIIYEQYLKAFQWAWLLV